MNNVNNTISVNILNNTFAVSCPSGQAAKLQHCAEQLNEKLRDASRQNKTADYDRLVTITALNLIHELNGTKHFNEQIAQLEQRLADTLTQKEQMELDSVEN